MAHGKSLTFLCCSDVGYKTFSLSKKKIHQLPQSSGQKFSQDDFPLGPVTISHGGQYRCSVDTTSPPSGQPPVTPLDILIAGQIPETPSLSVQPGHMAASGENMAVLCQMQREPDALDFTSNICL
ncbi:leukocyte immunoglobulin-like receptor subfamily B member 5 [Symphalangus syndactylus]|uniref:leukocyte immunoglobulin-like receptor subfamily B member 5 n=1 Tax=Symphalangus syndactylus TaxID=9590 RepID=UPI003003BA6D